MSLNKKGAMELSISTIVIVVIGITLLVLGLVFVRGIFDRLGGLGTGAFEKAEQELSQIQSGDTKINFPRNIEVQKGDASSQTIRVCNVDGTLQANSQLKLQANNFYNGLRMQIGSNVLSGSKSVNINLGTIEYQKCRPLPVQIIAEPNVAVSATQFPYLTITVQKGNDVYESIGTNIKVT